MLEQERQRIEQLTAGWDDPTQVDWGAESEQDGITTESAPSGPVLKCTALYSYTVRLYHTHLYFELLTLVFKGPKPRRIDNRGK